MSHNLENLDSKTQWTTVTRPFFELWSSWELHLNSIFIDLHPQISLLLAPRLTGLFLMIIVYNFYYIFNLNSRKISLLVLFLTIIPSVTLIIPDLIFSSQKSVITRYFFPSFLGIQIAISFWLVEARSNQNKIRWLVFYLLIVSGLASAIISSQSFTWWNKLVGYHNPQIAAIINRYDRPLLISNDRDINVGNLISLSYLLAPKVKLLLVDKSIIPKIPEGDFSEILVWNLAEESLKQFQQQNNCQLQIISGNYYPSLWLKSR
jgi:hypothetical protein